MERFGPQAFDALAQRLAGKTSRRTMLAGFFLSVGSAWWGAACAGSGKSDGRSNEAGARGVTGTPFDAETLSADECAARGGTYQAWGLKQQQFCQIAAPDARKPCTDGSQCSLGRCISRNGASPGGCQTFQEEFGCQANVSRGQVGATLCVD